MSHAHAHGQPAGRRLGLSIALTVLFVGGEATAGYLSNSLALLSDAGHNFADALALALSWYALRAARRPADGRRTFGSHRVGVLAALANAVSLVVLALLIFWEAGRRVLDPEPVASGPMIGVALVAVVLNTVIAVWLHGEARHDLNVRSAYLHMVGDAVSAVGVVAAGAVVAWTGWELADPVVSLLIGGLILYSSWGILNEAVNVLLEAAPAGLDTAAVARAAAAVPGVRGVHHLHVWTITSGLVACSLHVIVGEQSVREGQRVTAAVADRLREEFGIGHTTVQVETAGCAPEAPGCTAHPADHHDHPDHAAAERRV